MNMLFVASECDESEKIHVFEREILDTRRERESETDKKPLFNEATQVYFRRNSTIRENEEVNKEGTFYP